MNRVLHYDHAHAMTRMNLFEIGEALRNAEGISYERYDGMCVTPGCEAFNLDKQGLERRLEEEEFDVLLIHPGTAGQQVVLREYPDKFPNLKIVVLSYVTDDYIEPDSRVQVMDYEDKESIVGYVITGKRPN